MKARPARKNSPWVMSTAAMRLPTSPAIEMAFGVSRDSISRLRAISRISAAVRRPWTGSAIARGDYATAWRRAVCHAQAAGRARPSA